MYGYVGLCTAIERNVFHILANGEPLYDAYTTYLPQNDEKPHTAELDDAQYRTLKLSSCLDTRQPGNVFKKLDTRQSEILTNFLEIARLIPLRT